MNESKRRGHYVKLGPGGMRCPCCGPRPGKPRRRALRAAKRRERRDVNHHILEELST